VFRVLIGEVWSFVCSRRDATCLVFDRGLARFGYKKGMHDPAAVNAGRYSIPLLDEETLETVLERDEGFKKLAVT
jgi:hypothetical protein